MIGEKCKGCAFHADGILGTGICFTQACRDRMNQAAASDAALKQAQAAALGMLASKPASSSMGAGTIILIIVFLLLIAGGIFLVIKKRK